ncbi:histidine kinase N-terminal domain-containing protein [Hoyosella rhizosphaerae]|uniref:histidine kinase n=1 Tax=Hoyosella rhizosphaerae TaxID=1755582 RepID=A0A916UAF6_9ACTN|nr:PAS domain-containing sensor histidine kinase [Hoyosella rhizosphaerae]MBN4925979.1 histidine kinase N-terminal domain-containing protein [Hoyosella rhizosphaerae]GGC66505.1 putative two component sensor kinase [Hoyosella rhizosphaerae]
MATLSALLAEHTDLPGEAVNHLQRLVGEWQLIADLAFSDFLMWVATGDLDEDDGSEDLAGARAVCVAQCRPTTSPTVYSQDLVNSAVDWDDHPELIAAMLRGEILREDTPRWHEGTPLAREAIPVRSGGEIIAVITRDTSLAQLRVPSALEMAYIACGGELCQMICDGTFPLREDLVGIQSSPRAGDGLIRVAVDGTVAYTSPNALSAYHRMGLSTEIAGLNLAAMTRPLISDPFDAQEFTQRLAAVMARESSMRMEIDARGATVLFRALPLYPHGAPCGALVLVRDITEVKRRDRALLSKDATIREIHHRVKNNLQTVAALLRLQVRRTTNEEARQALAESVRRVSSIALVHDTLSMSVDEQVNLDDVIDRLVPMMVDVATIGKPVSVRREGSLGVMAADKATPLVMVLTELVQNAIEHAFNLGATGNFHDAFDSDERSESGEIVLRAERSARWLDVVIHDNGNGLPDGFSLERSDRLGLQIVRTLVGAELGGSLSLQESDQGGTDAVLRVPLGRRRN